jgi:cytochrome c oxidase subunit 3
MTQVVRSNFQSHPFHLVSPSPWPMYTSFSLFSLTASGALSMHSFDNAYLVFFVALLTLVSSMSLWFRDIISEGKLKINSYNFNISKAISIDNINEKLIYYKNNNNITI